MVRRQNWTEEEDEALVQIVKFQGESSVDWDSVSMELYIQGVKKNAKQARERWEHQLNPKLKRHTLSREELKRLFSFHEKFGSKWKKISSYFEGRTDGNLKNQFFAQVRKSLRRARKFLPSDFVGVMSPVKPRILSKILGEKIDVPELAALNQPKRKSWLESPFEVRNFVTFFAFSKQAEIDKIEPESLSLATTKVFTRLTEMNESYCERKKKILSLLTNNESERKTKNGESESLEVEEDQAVPKEGPSLLLSSRTFFFYLKQLFNTLEAPQPSLPDTTEIFREICSSSDDMIFAIKRESQLEGLSTAFAENGGRPSADCLQETNEGDRPPKDLMKSF